MGPETMQPVLRLGDLEFVRMISSNSLRMEYLKKANALDDWNEVQETLRDWLVQGEEKSHAIHQAVKYGHPDLVVDNFLEFEAEINMDTLISLHTLHLAAERGYPEIVSLLIKHCRSTEGGKLEQLINGQDSKKHWTPLHWACENVHTHVAKVLLHSDVGILLDLPTTTDFTTPLHLAIKSSVTGEDPVNVMARTGRSHRAALVDLVLKSPEGTALLNSKDWQGNTPLHLAVETMNVDVVELLKEQPRLIATEKNNGGKTPTRLLWDQTHSDQTRDVMAVKIIGKHLMGLHDVQHEHEALTHARSRYYNAANSLLVVGAFLAQTTFSGILSMVDLPNQFATEICPNPLVPQFSAECSSDVMKYKPYYVRAVDVFRGSNNLSFYFAIFTIMAATRIIISRGENIPPESELSRLQNWTILISLAVTFSTISAVVAFISGGLGNIPVAESGWGDVLTHWASRDSEPIFKSTMLTTTMVGLILIIPFILIPLFLDDVAIFRVYLDTKFHYWDSQHSRWQTGRWRSFFTLVLAVLFLVLTLYVMFMLIFGLGLQSEKRTH